MKTLGENIPVPIIVVFHWKTTVLGYAFLPRAGGRSDF
jgi:hypothetical protein